MNTIIKHICAFFILLSINSYAEKFIQELSNEVKIKYSQDGLVSIHSIHQGKSNHHYNLKLKSMGSGENLIHFPSPKSLVINKGVPTNQVVYMCLKRLIINGANKKN